MKKILFFIIILFSGHSFAAKNDSLNTSFWKGLNISLMTLEWGQTLPINSKKSTELPAGMNHYLDHNRRSFSSNIGSIGVFHQNKIGLEIVFVNLQLFESDNSDFIRYLEQKYPKNDIGYSPFFSSDYRIIGLGYRLAYKHSFNKFTLAPKFQLGFNNYKYYNDFKVFQEYDSNQFLEHRIEKKSLNAVNIDYHFILDLSTTIDIGVPIEFGIKAEYIMMPTNYNYTITEQLYNQAATVTAFNYKSLNASFLFGFTSRIVIKRGTKINEPLWKRKKQPFWNR